MNGENGKSSTRQQVLTEIRNGSKFLLATHEKPDGDALGSLSAMQQALTALGKDSLSYMTADEFPLPREYRSIAPAGLISEAPDDLAQRTIIFLDCGNINRNPADALKGDQARTINVDHHHDNTHFAKINLVVPEASCTAEIVWGLITELGVELTKSIAEALYVGLVTDTGRFMYDNTGPVAHRMAGQLIEVGVDVDETYRRLYEGIPQGKLELLAIGLTNVRRYDGGALTLTQLTQADFKKSNADESFSEGLVDYLRAVNGTAVAGLIREQLSDNANFKRKVSLRATDSRIDVSEIARALGGGGHRRAAGFSTDLEFEELVSALRGELAKQFGD